VIEDSVLVIFPTCGNDIKFAEIVRVIMKRFALKDISIQRVTYEKGCIVFEVNNLVDAMSSISEIYGIDRVAIAKKVKNEFQDLVKNIVRIGKKLVVPHNSFFVKILEDDNAIIDFKSRDVQFVASGDLLADTAKNNFHIKIARDENLADHLLMCYIGKNASYVFIQSEIGLGGLPYNSQHCNALSTIHNPTSAASCLASLKCGLVPEICLLYHDTRDLKDNAKLLGLVANRVNQKRMKIMVGHIEFGDVGISSRNALLSEAVAICLLAHLPGRNIVLPLNIFIHSFSFVEQTLERMRKVNKLILSPLLFLDKANIINTLEVAGMTNMVSKSKSRYTASKQECRKCYERADKLSRKIFDNLKTISFEIGPNYVHDIIDTV
jgi:adenylyl- and sulfurtransferase ThiI